MTSPGDDTTQLSDDDVIIFADAVRAALKEFADLRIDLKILAAQAGREQLHRDPESCAGLWAGGPNTSSETPGIAGVTKVKADFC
jgi:hypothetical protein